jgi:GT2 family glycosyltransferase
MGLVSIVLPTLIRTTEQFNTTIKCIKLAREKTDLAFELVIVETETNYLEEYADRYIHVPTKSISTRDLNLGFSAASGLYVGLLTNDVYVDQGWLEVLLETFQKKKDCGISTLASTQFNEVLQPSKIDEWVWCSVFLTKKEYFEKYGYFDAEMFPQVFDDTDFVMRLAIQGLKSYKNYSCVVHHKIGLTEYADPKHMENYYRNKERFNEKYKDYAGHPTFEHLR